MTYLRERWETPISDAAATLRFQNMFFIYNDDKLQEELKVYIKNEKVDLFYEFIFVNPAAFNASTEYLGLKFFSYDAKIGSTFFIKNSQFNSFFTEYLFDVEFRNPETKRIEPLNLCIAAKYTIVEVLTKEMPTINIYHSEEYSQMIGKK